MGEQTQRVWARHYQDDWQARAGDPRLPYWLRVSALAYGSHADNGHARFKRGEVALILASVDRGTGEVRLFANVRREIARAVEFGWLEDGSYWGCLIVPAHAIHKGTLYLKPKPCPLTAHHRERSNRSPSERLGVLKPTPSERFGTQTAHPVSGLQRKSLLSDLSTAPARARYPTPTPQQEIQHSEATS